ncbi:MAG: hypothetical protein HQM12_03515 [SAR324 cluster bacterium]|nr:hypothetical protein [SAR324 cluster bacterium]
MALKTGENAFIILMETAREDPQIRQQLLNLLKIDSFNRQSMLNTFMEEMRMKGASSEFIEAVSYLKEEHIAEKAIQLITDVRHPVTQPRLLNGYLLWLLIILVCLTVFIFFGNMIR